MVTVATDLSQSQGVPASSAVNVGWASFDPCVVLGEVAPSSTASAVSKTTNGRPVRVALRFAAPPAASYVYLDTDDCADGGDPMVVAADGGLLLIHMRVQVEKGVPAWRFSDNFFVCEVDPERTWLEGLPCLGGWMGVPRHTGLMRCGDEFFVADLQPRAVKLSDGGTGEVAELFRYSSVTRRWELKRLDMPSGRGLYPLCWQTDTVFSFGGYMCWADYHRGILFCNVSTDHPELRFVSFPLTEIRHDFRDGRGLIEKDRTASVSEGHLWFVDVDGGRFPSTGRTLATCTITAWTLKTPEMEWVKEHTLHLGELWLHWKYRASPLPRSVPGFPVVDMQEADVLHFVVRESAAATMHWTITVAMKNRCLMAYELYQNAIEVPESDIDVSNIFCDTPLICCKYT